MPRNHCISAGVVGLLAWALLAGTLCAQTNSGVRIYDEQLRVTLDRRDPADKEMGFDAGGWLNFTLLHFDDDASLRRRTLNQFQLRGWASANINNVHKAYFRGLLTWDLWAGNDNIGASRNHEFQETVERAWYEIDLGKLIEQQSGQTPPWGFTAKIGREYTTIGTGLALSMPLDAIDMNFRYRNLEFRTLLGLAVKDSFNRVDRSGLIAERQDRCFWGFELAYNFSEHRPFAYFLSQSDHSTPYTDTGLQRYDYSSRYLGLGSTGTLIWPDLAYSAELVGEWGRTFSSNAWRNRDEICALAADVQLEYYFRVDTHPRVSVEYIYASGDSDRGTSSSTVGGNTAGTRDKAFNGFGFRDTGIAFAPAISNLHIYIAGASFYPLEDIQLFRKMELGTKLFFYQKANESGGISDAQATDQASWVGWEWDVFCNWRVTSDLSWTARYGVFMPGSCFRGQADSPRHFLYTGILLSF